MQEKHFSIIKSAASSRKAGALKGKAIPTRADWKSGISDVFLQLLITLRIVVMWKVKDFPMVRKKENPIRRTATDIWLGLMWRRSNFADYYLNVARKLMRNLDSV